MWAGGFHGDGKSKASGAGPVSYTHLRPGCPALTKNEDGTISIDDTMCNGCGLCKQLCPADAIEEVEV